MTTPRTRKLITIAIALSIGFASSAAAAETHRAAGELPILPVVTVTPDAGELAHAAGRRLPLMPTVTVTRDSTPTPEVLAAPLPRERIADGRVLPRLPTVEVAATVAPVEPVATVAAAHPVEPSAAAETRGSASLVTRTSSSVRFTMPYYSFGNRSGGVEQ
jgi:hypothetical protein